MDVRKLFLAGMTGGLLIGSAIDKAEALNCRTDAFGVVTCDTGSLPQAEKLDVLPDDQKQRWRKDSFGNVRGRDGATRGKDSFDNLSGDRRNSWRLDEQGNIRGSDGPVCRNDASGTLRCE